MSTRTRGSARASAWILLGTFALMLPTGCGGGGGSQASGPGGLTNAVFNGDYVIAGFRALASPAAPADADYVAPFGLVSADGVSLIANNPGSNDDGVVTPPSPGISAVYTVAADGTLSFQADPTGGIRTDGAVALWMGASNGAPPNVLVFLRPSGVYSDASLAGSFHLAQIYGRAGGAAPSALFTTTVLGPLVADGAGGATVPTMNFNTAGTVVTTPGGAVGYAVAANGVLAITLLNGNYTGGLSSDGAFAIAAGGTIGGQDPQMAVLIKTSSLLTNAAFSGSYWAIGISSDPTDQNRWTSFVGSVTSNGAGAMSYASTTENHEGVISANSGPDTYSVSADGSLTTPGGRVGAVSSDGQYAFLSGSLTPGVGPLLFVFLRK